MAKSYAYRVRDRLGLTAILKGQSVQRIYYSDRYLQPEGAEILADLLQGDWLHANVEISVRILEQRGQSPTRRSEIQTALQPINGRVRQQSWHEANHKIAIPRSIGCRLSSCFGEVKHHKQLNAFYDRLFRYRRPPKLKPLCIKHFSTLN